MNDLNSSNFEKTEEPVPVHWLSRALRICVALVIVGGSLAGASYLMKTAEKPKKRPPVKWVQVVRVLPLQRKSYQIVVAATGTVIPARRIVMRSRVSGQVVAVHKEFIEGGFLEKGATVLQLDDADYRLALAQKKSDVIKSQYALKVELGRQEVARREWQLLGGHDPSKQVLSKEDLPQQAGTALALRGPHLEKARADVEIARIQVRKAELDLERTRITAPFNAVVKSRSVDIGSQVSPQEQLAELVGIDNYWVRVPIPVDRLDRITIPRNSAEPGSPVRMRYARGHTVGGRVIRLMSDLDAASRMARVLIEVKDPLRRQAKALDGLPLLIGEFVRVEILGRKLEAVITIPRAAHRDGETVWLLNPDMTLRILKVMPIWRDKETVVIQNALNDGDRIIISELSAPVAGMQLRLDRAP